MVTKVEDEPPRQPSALRFLAGGAPVHNNKKASLRPRSSALLKSELNGPHHPFDAGGATAADPPGLSEGNAPGGGGGGTAGPHSATNILAEQLRQAERSLAAHHEGVLRLVGQLLDERSQALGARRSLQYGWDFSSPLLAETDKASLLTHFSVAAEDRATGEPEHDAAPQRPSSQGAPWRPVPSPETDAPRMSLPGTPLEEEDEEEGQSSGKDQQDDKDSQNSDSSNQAFVVSDVFKDGSKKMGDRGPARSKAGSRMKQSAVIRRARSSSERNFNHLSAQKNLPKGSCKYIILHPNNVFRAIWDIASMLLVLYDMVMVPFGFFEPEVTTGMIILEWTTRVFWTQDIPMSFVSGFVTMDGTIEMRPWRIAVKYFRSWFLLDVAVVSADWTEIILGKALEGMDVGRLSKVTRIFRIIRMIRLLRLAKVGEIVNLLAERLPSDKLVVLVDVLKLIVIMLGTGHLMACVWYIIGKDFGDTSRVEWNWLQQHDFAEEALEYRYIMSLRWALAQFAGGMDEVTPVSLAEHIYAGMMYIFAFWSGAVFLSILTSHFTQLYILGNQQSQQLNVMRRYLAQNGISKGLVLRVTRNAQHTMRMRQQATPEAAVGLLEVVSEPLRIELHYEMYFPLLGLHLFFADYMRACPFVVRKICHGAMSTITYSKDDVIFHFGETANRMLIVRSGTLAYTWGDEDIPETLSEGRWLSEPPLWTRWAHRGVLTATEDAILFSVNAKLFQTIVSTFEISIFDPGEYAVEFVQRLNATAPESLTDLPVKTEAARHDSSWGWNGRATVSFKRATMMFRRSPTAETPAPPEDMDDVLSRASWASDEPESSQPEEAVEEDDAADPTKPALGTPFPQHFPSAKKRTDDVGSPRLSAATVKKSMEGSMDRPSTPVTTKRAFTARLMHLEDLCKEEEV